MDLVAKTRAGPLAPLGRAGTRAAALQAQQALTRLVKLAPVKEARRQVPPVLLVFLVLPVLLAPPLEKAVEPVRLEALRRLAPLDRPGLVVLQARLAAQEQTKAPRPGQAGLPVPRVARRSRSST